MGDIPLLFTFNCIFKRKMQHRGLLFIPDISGFTRFVNETDIDHSRLIIQELLEALINSNTIGLEISEIEGDAILFYRFGESPSLPEIYRQVEEMFITFHRNIRAYDNRRFCQCNACRATINLTLKVITHYGEFTGYNVKNFNKLIGKDIIVAHQLLKNDIGQHEYWLVTQSLLPTPDATRLPGWIEWSSSSKQTEAGEISFQYTQLSPLKENVKPDPPPKLELSSKIKVLSLSNDYDCDLIPIFHATGDMNYRSRWEEGVDRVEEISPFLPRMGMRCRVVSDRGEKIVYASSYHYEPEKITFSETEDETGRVTFFTLEELNPHRTRVTIDYYLPRAPFKKLLFQMTEKKQLGQRLRQSLLNLSQVAASIKLPVASPGL